MIDLTGTGLPPRVRFPSPADGFRVTGGQGAEGLGRPLDQELRSRVSSTDLSRMRSDTGSSNLSVRSAPVTREVSGYAAQPPYTYDPEKAKALLAEAGFADGFNASIDINPRFVQSSPLAIAMISDWSAIGVRVMPRELEHSVWVDRLRAGKYDMTLAPNFAFTGDAEWSIGRLYVCANKRLGYCNERVDELVGEARRAVDAQRRQALYEEIDAILWQDAPSMWPFELVVNYAWRNRVTGFVPAPSQVPDFSRSVRVTQ